MPCRKKQGFSIRLPEKSRFGNQSGMSNQDAEIRHTTWTGDGVGESDPESTTKSDCINLKRKLNFKEKGLKGSFEILGAGSVP